MITSKTFTTSDLPPGWVAYCSPTWPPDRSLCDVLLADGMVCERLTYTHWDIWRQRGWFKWEGGARVVGWRLTHTEGGGDDKRDHDTHPRGD